MATNTTGRSTGQYTEQAVSMSSTLSYSSIESTVHGDSVHSVSKDVTHDGAGHVVGHLTLREQAAHSGHEVVVSHTMQQGEAFDEAKFRAAAAGEKVAGYDVQENAWKASETQASSDRARSSTSVSEGHSGGASLSHTISHGRTYDTQSSSDRVGHSTSVSEGHSYGTFEVQRAVQDHLEHHGADASEAHNTARHVSESLGASFGATSSDRTSFDVSDSVNFHQHGDTAVSVGHSISASEGTSVSVSTLKDVHDYGMPNTGVAQLREHLGAELADKSNLEVVDTFGHDVTHAIGAQGFPHEAVQHTQAEHGVSGTEALQMVGEAARQDSAPRNESAQAHGPQEAGAEMHLGQ